MKRLQPPMRVDENPETGGEAKAAENPVEDQASKQPILSNLPDRYTVKELTGERIITCLEAPNISVHIRADSVVSGSAARKSPPGTIFLDGAAQGEPFLDHEKQIYNLDHHEGCVRPFTLATCEQAMVMIMKGLDLRDREWNVFANDPDLDTILAIWILFNHVRIGQKETTVRRLLLPLVRVEGVIDALGLELKEFCGLPQDLMRRMERKIDRLRDDEVAIKKEGRWQELDFLDYTARVLRKIDRMVYQSRDFADFKGVEELARVALTENRFAVVIDADMGIYEVESHLQKLYGNRLGVAILKRSPNAYTLRQMDLFMPGSLDDVYERLNYMDPAVKFPNEENRWGGAADIGGSPRMTGTLLSPQEIAQACRDAFQRLSLHHHVIRFLIAAVTLGGLLMIYNIFETIWQARQWFGDTEPGPIFELPAFFLALVLSLFTLVILGIVAGRKPWQYGLSLPSGKDWWLALPFAVFGGLIGGAWVLDGLRPDRGSYGTFVFAVFLVPLLAEFLFRSLVHGILARGTRIQHARGRWFISWPNAGAAVMYAGASGLVANTQEAVIKFPWPPSEMWQLIAGALVFGLAAGMARERSRSVVGAYAFHVITLVCVVLATLFF